MTEKDFHDIMDFPDVTLVDDPLPVTEGLKIITKYCPKVGICWAKHDMVGFVSVSEIVVAGITEEDAKRLAAINWTIERNTLACFI